MHNLQTAASANLIRSGDILAVRNEHLVGRSIRRAIGSWSNHNAILVRPEADLCVGESTWPRGRCTELADFDTRIAAGTTQVLVLRPTGTSAVQGSLAAAWWLRNAQGRPYDLGAYPRLILKSIFGDRCHWPAGWNWAWYCTESCRDAWLNGPHFDPWQKTNPTPRTTEKRLAEGAFQLIWASPSNTYESTVATAKAEPSTKNQALSAVASAKAEPRTFPLTTAKFTVAPANQALSAVAPAKAEQRTKNQEPSTFPLFV
jgi:hypothetical protein